MSPRHKSRLARLTLRRGLLPLAAVAGLALAQSGAALDAVDFQVPGADKATIAALKGASALLSQGKIANRSSQDLYADARAEYGRLIDALYAMGYYGPVIHVWVNGREAADIAPLDAPATITEIRVEVQTGPPFTFARSEVAPLARGTDLPDDFAPGRLAESGLIQAAVTAGIDGWRNLGHAKADIAFEDITADHDASTISAVIGLEPGPVLRFGPLTVTGTERMRLERVLKIAGLRPGLRYSPKELDQAAERLRRSGVFSSVTLVEDETITAPDSLGITAELVEAKLHRYSFGAEIASLDGAKLTGSWLHRNLFGGGERLTVFGEVANIGAQSSGMDYTLGATLDRPATPDADTTASLSAQLGHQDEVDYQADTFDTGLTFTHWFDDKLTGHLGLAYSFSQGRDDTGDFLFRTLDVPLGLTWDNRNSTTDATRGVYADATVKPFAGFGTTDNGVRLTVDARGYRSFAEGNAFTLAGRVQAGAVLGAAVLRTPRDDLFYSGGGGTVRGQPYQSLGAQVLRGGTAVDIGGTTFLGGSVEARYRLGNGWGVVGFLDAGLVDIGSFALTASNWQAGAGLGVRYETGFGPIRLDVAVPVPGGGAEDLQLYVGLGQSF